MIAKALSIRQPWAHMIIHCGKDIENRTWRTNFRGRVLVHVGATIDRAAYDILAPRWPELPAMTQLQTGGIIGMVDIVDCVDDDLSPWFQGPHGFVLKNPKALPFFKCRGHLSFFPVDYPDSLVGGEK